MMRSLRTLLCARAAIGLAAYALLYAGALAQTVYYVRPDGNDASNGLSWATAKRTIQAAVNAAPAGSEIRVARGTYAPFTLSKNLALKGGYAGAGATPNDRDLSHTQYPTIIDGGNANTPIQITHNATSATLIEGFIIQNGKTPDPLFGIGRTNGGGIALASGSPTLRHNRFRGNRVASSNNWGGAGGAVYIENGSPTIENCIFENNGIFGVNAEGGTVYVRVGSPVIRNCRFIGNYVNGVFIGGGVAYVEQGTPIFENNEFLNSAIQGTIVRGGVIGVLQGAAIVRGNRFEGNSVAGSNVSGGVVGIERGAPVIENNLFLNNTARNGNISGGALYVIQGAPVIANNQFIGNTADSDGLAFGGAVYLEIAGGTAQIRNNLFARNRAVGRMDGAVSAYGGALYLSGGVANLYNNTLVANRAIDVFGDEPSGAVWADMVNLQVRNNIFALHPPACFYHGGTNNTTATLAHNCFDNALPNTAGNGVQMGNANLFQNPQFVDAPNGDYRLRRNSPCIDAGDSSVVNWQTDMDGNPRIQSNAVDMGAYEFQGTVIAGDVNGDGCVDDADLLIVLFNFGGAGDGDVNRDGIVDDADLLIVLFNFGQGC